MIFFNTVRSLTMKMPKAAMEVGHKVGEGGSRNSLLHLMFFYPNKSPIHHL